MREESASLNEAQDFGEDTAEYFRERPDGTIDPAGEAGWYLQRERERRGETLEDAGEATGIHPYHIEAIEYGDMTHMPERREALEMIGTYAQYLGFDPEPLVQHYVEFLPRPAPALAPSHPANPAPLTSAKILKFGKLPQLPKVNFRLPPFPGGAGGLVASLAGAMLLFAGISYVLTPGAEDQARPEQVAMAPEAQAPASEAVPVDEPQETAASVKITEEPMPDGQPDVAATEGYSEDELAGTGLDGLSELIKENVPGSKTETTASIGTLAAAPEQADTPVQTQDGRQFGNASETSRVTLKAKAPVWIRIEDAQGKVVLTQMLMKGDTYRVPDREGLVVIARDGGLLTYLIDGKERGILGTPGEILVGRPLDVKSLEGNG